MRKLRWFAHARNMALGVISLALPVGATLLYIRANAEENKAIEREACLSRHPSSQGKTRL
jgi:hypothetical protein